MRDEAATVRIMEGVLTEGKEKIAGYGSVPPTSAPASFMEVRTDDPRKMKTVYDEENGTWTQVGADFREGLSGVPEE